MPKRRQDISISTGSELRFVEVFTTLQKTSPFAPPGMIPNSFQRFTRGA